MWNLQLCTNANAQSNNLMKVFDVRTPCYGGLQAVAESAGTGKI